jgi:hypothetical protein
LVPFWDFGANSKKTNGIRLGRGGRAMSELVNLGWEPPGPISERFVLSEAPNPILNGPVGSGKTTTNFFFHLNKAMLQKPSLGHGIRLKGEAGRRALRRYWMTVLRDDYRQLWRSTIPSWQQQFPPENGWTGATNAPAKHQLTFPLDDGSAVEFTAEFVALGDNNIEDFMRGYQPTAFFLNEIDLNHPDVLKHAGFRAGRFPPMREGGPSWYGITGDCNAPILDSWFYNDIYLMRNEASGFFRLPGGTDPGAENRRNLPPEYYDRQIAAIGDPYLIKRMVHNQPAPSRSGKPVHEEFDDQAHVAPRDLDPVPGLPLLIGMDAGLDPAAVIGQKLGNGRWLILDEMTTEHGTGPKKFSRLLNELLAERYPRWQERRLNPFGVGRDDWTPALARDAKIRAFVDPAAGWGGGNSDDDDLSWLDIVMHETGIRIEPAASNNNTTDRRAALQRVLTLMSDRKPAFQLSPRCRVLRAGLAGQFRYRKLNLLREERYTDEVEKNAHSHPCEALEYLLLGGGEAGEVHDRRERGYLAQARGLQRRAEGALGDW